MCIHRTQKHWAERAHIEKIPTDFVKPRSSYHKCLTHFAENTKTNECVLSCVSIKLDNMQRADLGAFLLPCDVPWVAQTQIFTPSLLFSTPGQHPTALNLPSPCPLLEPLNSKITIHLLKRKKAIYIIQKKRSLVLTWRRRSLPEAGSSDEERQNLEGKLPAMPSLDHGWHSFPLETSPAIWQMLH